MIAELYPMFSTTVAYLTEGRLSENVATKLLQDLCNIDLQTDNFPQRIVTATGLRKGLNYDGTKIKLLQDSWNSSKLRPYALHALRLALPNVQPELPPVAEDLKADVIACKFLKPDRRAI